MEYARSIAGLVIAGGTAIGALYAVGRNWLWVAARRQGRRQSPVLLVGPLFALITAGLLAQALPTVAGWQVWLFPVVIAVIDPGAIPLIVSRWLKS